MRFSSRYVSSSQLTKPFRKVGRKTTIVTRAITAGVTPKRSRDWTSALSATTRAAPSFLPPPNFFFCLDFAGIAIFSYRRFTKISFIVCASPNPPRQQKDKVLNGLPLGSDLGVLLRAEL